MRLIDDWRVVALRAWSMYGLYLIILINGLEFALPLVGEQLPISDNWRIGLTIGIGAAAAYLRLRPQKSISAGNDGDR